MSCGASLRPCFDLKNSSQSEDFKKLVLNLRVYKEKDFCLQRFSIA